MFAGTQPVRHQSLPCVQGQAYVPFAPLGVCTDGLVYLVCDVINNQSSPPAQTQLAYQYVNHEHHAIARKAMASRPRLIAHAAIESYSATLLSLDQRATPAYEAVGATVEQLAP